MFIFCMLQFTLDDRQSALKRLFNSIFKSRKSELQKELSKIANIRNMNSFVRKIPNKNDIN